MNTNGKIDEQQALNKAASYCSISEHCSSEIETKLKAWGMNDSETSRIITTLEEEGFIDNERYCKFFIHDKYKFAKWGILKIAQALKQKKIQADICTRMFDEVIDHSEYTTIIKDLIAAKKREIKDANTWQGRCKIMRFLTQRGFSYEDIAACLPLSDLPE